MDKYKHILVAVDLIPQDDDLVIERAHELALKARAEVSLVHVVEYFYIHDAPWRPENSRDWQEEVEVLAKQKLQDLAKKIDVPIERQYLHVGLTMDAILHTAERIQADLIIVGSHGRHGLGLMLFGSLATNLLQKTPCDVLAVKISVKQRSSLREAVEELMMEAQQV